MGLSCVLWRLCKDRFKSFSFGHHRQIAYQAGDRYHLSCSVQGFPLIVNRQLFTNRQLAH